MAEKSYNVYGWEEFTNEMKEEYTYINNISITSTIPIQVNLVFNLKRIPEREDIDNIFDNTIKFLSDEQTFNDIIEYHKKRNHDSFINIKLLIFHNDKNNRYRVNILSSQSMGDEPRLEYFTDWTIKYNDSHSEDYKKLP